MNNEMTFETFANDFVAHFFQRYGADMLTMIQDADTFESMVRGYVASVEKHALKAATSPEYIRTIAEMIFGAVNPA